MEYEEKVAAKKAEKADRDEEDDEGMNQTRVCVILTPSIRTHA